MNVTKTLGFIALAATVSACGSDFEWFPDVNDTFAPSITASIAGKTIFNNRTTHVDSFPATVTFISDEAATIYYTTNGSNPSTASPSIVASKNISATGPAITVTNTVLKFFGIDTAVPGNPSTVQSATIVSP